MTCKDCAGFQFCKDFLDRTKFYGSENADNAVESHCENFKDNSKFIEMPIGKKCYGIRIRYNYTTHNRKGDRVIKESDMWCRSIFQAEFCIKTGGEMYVQERVFTKSDVPFINKFIFFIENEAQDKVNYFVNSVQNKENI